MPKKANRNRKGVSLMRVAVVGAGGVGGFYGARLLEAGEDVAFVARGPHLDALRGRGLTFVTEEGGRRRERILQARAAADPVEIGEVDLVLLCVKSYDVLDAARSLQPLLGRETSVLALQNGLDHVEVLSEVLGEGQVMVGAVRFLAARIEKPGRVSHSGGEGEIVFGEPRGEPSARVYRLSDVFSRAGIPNRVSSVMQRVLWEKLLFIGGVGGVTALARAPVGPLLRNREGEVLITEACEEVAAVANAAGVDLGAGAVEDAMRSAAAASPSWRSSMARDLEEGRRLEVDALNGAVVRRGTRFGIPTPINRTIYACLSVHQPEGGDPQSPTVPGASAYARVSGIAESSQEPYSKTGEEM
jgi:2-dehydropantoate 2-reductase